MKNTKSLRSVLSMLLVLSMLFGMIGTALAVEVTDKDEDGVIRYVSLGASNVNGYGMRGYLEEEVHEYPLLKAQANIYGYKQDTPGSYPVLIKEYLESQGHIVELSQLAISSMRAEEVRFMLDESYKGDAYTDWRFCDVEGYDNRNSQNWFYLAGALEWAAKGNTGTPTQEQAVAVLREAYQDAIANADLITVDIGINNFGVYASNQIVSNMYENDLNTIDPELAAQYAEGKAYVMEVLQEYAGDSLAMMPVESLEHMADTMAYALVGFCLSFDAVMEQIYALNPDATVVVVSIQNLMYGLYAAMEGIEEPLPFGEIFGALINAANVYTATVSPYCDMYAYADVRKAGHVEFFSDELLSYDGNPESLSQDMKDCFDVYDNDLYIKTRVQQFFAKELYKEGYLDISAVPEEFDVVGNLEHFALAYQYGLLKVRGYDTTLGQFLKDGADGKLTGDFETYYNMFDVALMTAYDVMAEIMQSGVAIDTLDASSFGQKFGPVEDALLGAFFSVLEDAVAASVNDPEYSFDLDDVYPDGIYKTLAAQADLPEGFVNTVAAMGIRTGIGNSFYGHPNGNGQVELKNAIVAALENDITGKDVAKEELIKAAEDLCVFILEYYDEAYAYAYQYAAEEGYIQEAANAIDTAIKALEDLDLSGVEMTDAFRAELNADIEEIIETLEAAKALVIEADVLDQASLDALLALLDEAGEAGWELLLTLKQAGVDVTELAIIPALEKAYDIAVEKLTAAVQAGTAWLMEKLGDAYDALLDALAKLPGQIHDAGYDYLYNNPDKVIAFFNEYGDDMIDFIAQNQESIMNVIGWLAINYGDDVVDYVLENPETVLKVLVDYFNEHGEHGWALIDVYLKELGVYEQIDEALAQLAELLKNAGVDIVEELETLAEALIEKAEAALEELKEELTALKAQLENASGELAEEIKAKIAEIEAAIEALEQNLEELKAAVEKAIEEGIAAAAEELMAAVEEIKALLEELYIDATTDEYAVKSDSWYTAIGDGTAASESYVDYLAEDLNLGERYTNLAEAGQTILDAYDVITANKDTITKSDLITVGYGVNGFNTFVKNRILSGDTMDWSTITGEESVEYIDAALAELKAYFVEQGLDKDIQIPMVGTKNLADTLTLAVEAYAYAYIEYVTNYPEVINAIHEISPEALVIIVGMYNPLEGVVIEGIDLGEYLGCIVDATNAHSLAYAMLTENVIYVDAPEVETKKTASEMTAEALILEMMTGFKNLVPSENGHEYIKTQILNALEITGLLGDANGDGKVNNVDAMLVLQYYAGLGVEINTAVCDVDGNGKINNVDAMLILQYYAQIITVFPVEA